MINMLLQGQLVATFVLLPPELLKHRSCLDAAVLPIPDVDEQDCSACFVVGHPVSNGIFL